MPIGMELQRAEARLTCGKCGSHSVTGTTFRTPEGVVNDLSCLVCGNTSESLKFGFHRGSTAPIALPAKEDVMKCKEPGCTRGVKNRGLCQLHYHHYRQRMKLADLALAKEIKQKKWDQEDEMANTKRQCVNCERPNMAIVSKRLCGLCHGAQEGLEGEERVAALANAKERAKLMKPGKKAAAKPEKPVVKEKPFERGEATAATVQTSPPQQMEKAPNKRRVPEPTGRNIYSTGKVLGSTTVYFTEEDRSLWELVCETKRKFRQQNPGQTILFLLEKVVNATV